MGKGVAAQQAVTRQQDAFYRTESFDGAEGKAGARGMKDTGGQILTGNPFLIDANPDQRGGLEKIRSLPVWFRLPQLKPGFLPVITPLGLLLGGYRDNAKVQD